MTTSICTTIIDISYAFPRDREASMHREGDDIVIHLPYAIVRMEIDKLYQVLEDARKLK